KIKAISDYQFGPEITDVLFANPKKISILKSKNTGKIKYIRYDSEHLLTLRPSNGLFTINFQAASLIRTHCAPPKLRAIVLTEISEFIKQGRNVFCKHVIDIDKNLRPLDEVIIVNQEDELLAIGKLKIPVLYVKSFDRGVAIKVRKGINSKI
ncbi:MAG: pseudouridine synthase, partial [Candidatus Lokiarchaeota archaeon]|nr:pseudouridine synthase [Candidatus Lokiarchaeota archaeon]MBD3340021.1 pseudouridine synthase [Candidatus Lokiarchaeota archaeon]